MYQIAYNIEIITAILSIIVILIGKNRNCLPIAFFVLYVIGADLLSKYAVIQLPDGAKSNHYYYNLERIPEIFFLIWIWRRNMGTNLKNNLIPFALSIFWLLFALINILFIQGFFVLNTGTFLLGSFIIITLAAIALFKIVDEKTSIPIFTIPAFWFWAALLINNSFTFTYRVFEPITSFSNSALFQSTIVIAAIIKYLFISIAFILILQKRFFAAKNGQSYTTGA